MASKNGTVGIPGMTSPTNVKHEHAACQGQIQHPAWAGRNLECTDRRPRSRA